MVVVDASAVLYLLASDRGMEPLAAHELVAPALLWSEATSVLSEMRWRNEISDALAETAFERLLTAPIARRSEPELYRQATSVARRMGWAKTYDAEYVALASMLDTTLVSRDARLRRGAGQMVSIVGPDDLVR